VVLFPPTAASLVKAFVAAQCVHFVAVIVTIALDNTHFLRHFSIGTVLTVGIGFSVVILAGLTATPRPSRLHNALHSISLYLIYPIFLLAYFKHPVKPLRVVALLLVIALVIRLKGLMTHTREPVKMATSA
jgi:hypothetical protein